MKQTIRLITCTLIALLTCACHNVVEYGYGNIGLLTRYWHDDEFVQIEIGSPLQPYTGSPELLIKMSDGTVLNPATADLRMIQEKCPGQSDWSGFPCHDFSTRQRPPPGTKWPAGTVRWQDESRLFFVCSNQLVAMRISWDGIRGTTPAVGNPRTGDMYPFPLSAKTVVSLFGKPDHVSTHLYE